MNNRGYYSPDFRTLLKRVTAGNRQDIIISPYNQILRFGSKSPVDDRYVVIKNTDALPIVAADTHDERAGAVPDEQLVKIKRL